MVLAIKGEVGGLRGENTSGDQNDLARKIGDILGGEFAACHWERLEESSRKSMICYFSEDRLGLRKSMNCYNSEDRILSATVEPSLQVNGPFYLRWVTIAGLDVIHISVGRHGVFGRRICDEANKTFFQFLRYRSSKVHEGTDVYLCTAGHWWVELYEADKPPVAVYVRWMQRRYQDP